jgi:hypothetical protein
MYAALLSQHWVRGEAFPEALPYAVTRLVETPDLDKMSEMIRTNLKALRFHCFKCNKLVLPKNSVRRITVRPTPEGDAAVQLEAGTLKVTYWTRFRAS